MEWGMWRRFLLFLSFVGKGTLADGSNCVVFDKLCDITRGVKGLMNQGEGAKGPLEEALYGETGRARYANGDELSGIYSGCGLIHHPGRSIYCSHMGGGDNDNHGCLGHSLVGTLLCTCVPGNQDDKDLCGLGRDLIGKGFWTSGTGDHIQKLFKEVWGKINKTCTENSTSGHLENLKSAVEGIRGKAQQQNGKYYVTLGGGTNTSGICSGTIPGDACVTYEGNGSGIPIIPWADKILTAITTFKEAIQRQTSSPTSATQTGLDHPEDPSDPDPGYEQEGMEEEGEEPVKNPDPQNTSKTPRPKRKRRSVKKPTEQPEEPLRVILHQDDGSFLPQPFWLLSAVLI